MDHRNEFTELYKRIDPYNYLTHGRQKVTAGFIGNLFLGRASHIPLQILELAAGEGVITEELCRMFRDVPYRITATDINEEALTRLKGKDLKWVRTVQCDLKNDRLSGIYDAVIVSDILPYLTDAEKEAVLSQSWGVLRKGGFLILSTWFSDLAMSGIDDEHMKYLHLFYNGEVTNSMVWRGRAKGFRKGEEEEEYPTGANYMAIRRMRDAEVQ